MKKNANAHNRFKCSTSHLRLLSMGLSILIISSVKGQNFRFRTSDPVVNMRMNHAVENARIFLMEATSAEALKHFVLLLPESEVVKDSSSFYNSIYFTDSITVIPDKYVVSFKITVDEYTLKDFFNIPIDSLGNVDKQGMPFQDASEDLKAYRKLFSGGYKFDFSAVKHFMKQKRLKSYFVRLMNGRDDYLENHRKTDVHKYYWYVYRLTPSREYGFKIDPETGRTRYSALKPVKIYK